MGLFDQYCNAETRMNYPSLYQATQKSEYFNYRVFWLWIAKSIIHSVVLFWMPMWGFSEGVVWVSGKNGDYLVVGNIVYTLVVITVCLKAGLEIESWSWITHVTIWGSIGFWFVFLIVYSFFWPLGLPVAANMAGMINLIVSTPLFWLGILLVPFVALMPDVIYKAIKVTAFTSETDKIRIAEVMKKDVSMYVPRSANNGLRLSESSALLRNVRKVFRRNAGSTGNTVVVPPPVVAQTNLESGDDDAAAAPRPTNEEIELAHGYAFSQEEGGAVSQAEFVRRYDTTARSPRERRRLGADSAGAGGGGT